VGTGVMAHPLVVHKSQPHDVYVGRPSKWGNPFKIGRDAAGAYWSRDDVIQLYASWVQQEIADGRLDVEELRGKRLACWCAPQPCHGDVLARLANA
jgi:hypothetical protein